MVVAWQGRLDAGRTQMYDRAILFAASGAYHLPSPSHAPITLTLPESITRSFILAEISSTVGRDSCHGILRKIMPFHSCVVLTNYLTQPATNYTVGTTIPADQLSRCCVVFPNMNEMQGVSVTVAVSDQIRCTRDSDLSAFARTSNC